MTRAIFHQDKSGRLIGFVVTGHAGANQDEPTRKFGRRQSPRGKTAKRSDSEYDLVCAAISAIAFTALGGLDGLCGLHDYEEHDGDLRLTLPDGMEEQRMQTAQIILRTMEIGLMQVEMQYREHITVVCKEV